MRGLFSDNAYAWWSHQKHRAWDPLTRCSHAWSGRKGEKSGYWKNSENCVVNSQANIRYQLKRRQQRVAAYLSENQDPSVKLRGRRYFTGEDIL